MKSKTSFFSRTLFFNILRRFWPLFAAYPAVWLLALPANLNSSLSWAEQNGQDVLEEAALSIMNQGAVAGPIITAVFAVLFAMAAFSCFYSSRSVSAVCTLPVRREGLFLSLFLTGPVVMLASNLLVAAVTLAVQEAYGAGASGYVLQWLGMVTMQGIFFCGFAALCASLTGNLFVLPLVYLVLNLTCFVVVTLFQFLTSLLVYGFPLTSSGAASVLSPIFFMLAYSGVTVITSGPNDIFAGVAYDIWLYIGVCAAVGVLFALLAMRLFRIRRMEAAGDVVVFRPLKPIFKYCLCFGCSLVLGLGAFYLFLGIQNPVLNNISSPSGIIILALSMLLSAFVGYFSAEMLIHKTLRVFQPHRWKGFGAAALVIAALILLLEFDVFGIERRVPEKESVQSVSIHGFEPVNISQEDDQELLDAVLALHRNVIESKEENERLLSSGGDTFSKGGCNVSLRYSLKNGGSLTRDYNISEDLTETMQVIYNFFNAPEIITKRKAIGFDVTESSVYSAYLDCYDPETSNYESIELEPGDAYRLYTQGIVPDMEKGNIGLIWPWSDSSSVNGLDYSETFMACTVNITFTRVVNGLIVQNDFRTNVTVRSANTLAILKELGVEPITYAQADIIGRTQATKSAGPAPADTYAG